jgi:hypothetical protein
LGKVASGVGADWDRNYANCDITERIRDDWTIGRSDHPLPFMTSRSERGASRLYEMDFLAAPIVAKRTDAATRLERE